MVPSNNENNENGYNRVFLYDRDIIKPLSMYNAVLDYPMTREFTE